MLKTLAGRDQSERTAILVSATDYLLPHPDEEGNVQHRGVVESLLREVGQAAKVDPSDMSSSARAALLEILLPELRKHVSSTEQTASARSRLGQRGDLSPTSYRIEFIAPTLKQLESRGIRRAHVENALASPDSVQHFLPELFGRQSDATAISLYTRTHVTPSHPLDTSTLLVQTMRINATQRVDTAWLVFHADVDLSEAKEPLDVLRAFVAVYGLEFSVGVETEKIKFLLYQTMPPLPEGQERPLFGGEAPSDAKVEVCQIMRLNQDRSLEIALLYAINLSRYAEDLRRHRVSVNA